MGDLESRERKSEYNIINYKIYGILAEKIVDWKKLLKTYHPSQK